MVLDAVAAIGFAPRSALTKIQDPLKSPSPLWGSWPMPVPLGSVKSTLGSESEYSNRRGPKIRDDYNCL